MWLSLQGTANYASLSVSTLRRYLSDAVHPLPHYLVGGKILCNPDEIDEWIRGFARSGNELETIVNELLSETKRSRRAAQ